MAAARLSAILIGACALLACSGDDDGAPGGAGGGGGTSGASGTAGRGAAGSGAEGGGPAGAGGSAGTPIVLGPEPQPPADLSADVFQLRFAELRCAQLERCCDAAFDAARCVPRAYAEWAAREQTAAPMAFNPVAAAHCLKHLAEAPCSDRTYLYCDGVYRTLAARGESCDLVTRCEPSLAGDVQCLNGRCVVFWERAENERCVGDYENEPGAYATSYGFVESVGRETELAMCPRRRGLECVAGVCVPATGTPCFGATCSEQEYCDGTLDRCAGKPRAGEPASAPCYQSYPDAETGLCAPLRAGGAECFTAAMCESGYCSLDMSCSAPGAEFCSLGE